MKKFIAVAVVLSMCAGAYAQGDLLWGMGGKALYADYTGGLGSSSTLYQYDTFTGVVEEWATLNTVMGIHAMGFVDDGQRWYIAGSGRLYENEDGGSRLAIFQPVPQGQTAPVLWEGFVDNLPGYTGQRLTNLNLVNGVMYYTALLGSHAVGDPDSPPPATGWREDIIGFGYFNLDANGVPVSAVQSDITYLHRQNQRTTYFCGGLTYNADRGMWATVMMNNRWRVNPDPMTTEWSGELTNMSAYTDGTVTAVDGYEAALHWVTYTVFDEDTFQEISYDVIYFGRHVANFGTLTTTKARGTVGTGLGGISPVLAIPEPATLALLAIGGLGLIARRRRSA